MFEAGIWQLISSAPSFSALAGSRLYPVLFPENCKLPAAAYQVISTRPVYALEERVNVTSVRVQFSALGASYADAKNLMAAIGGVIDNFSGALGNGVKVLGVQLVTSGDRYESDARVFLCTADYLFQYSD